MIYIELKRAEEILNLALELQFQASTARKVEFIIPVESIVGGY